MKPSAILILVVALLAAGPAQACEPVLNLVSRHFDKNADYNERNFGVGIECGQWQTGTYRNSVREQSYYVSYMADLAQAGPFEFGLMGGAVTGYPTAAIAPLAAVTVTWRTWRLLLVPPLHNKGENLGLVGLQLVLPVSF